MLKTRRVARRGHGDVSMGIFGRLLTPGAFVPADAGQDSSASVKPQEPADKERKAPPPAPSGVRPQSASQPSATEVKKPPPPVPQKSPTLSTTKPIAGAPPKPAPAKAAPPPPPAKAGPSKPPSQRRKSSRPPKKSKSIRPPATGLDAVLDLSTAPIAALDDASSIASTFESLLGDLDDHFAGIVENEDQAPRAGHEHTAQDLNDVRSLFAELAAHHMRSVRDFMIDVKWGEATRDWLPVCEPAVRSLMRASERLEIDELTKALSTYADALAKANLPEAVDGKTLTSETRDLLLSTYDKMIELMPQAFALEMDRSQREAVIVQSLLLQIPDVRKVTIDKLYAANLTSLDVMFMAKVDEVMQTTGIEKWLAQRIVDRFQAYRHEMKAAGIDATRSGEHDKLTMLASELRTQHAAFEDASTQWMGDAASRRKQLRQARNATLLQIKVILARLGEVDRLHAIDRLPFEQKIAELEAYLEKARDKYVPM